MQISCLNCICFFNQSVTDFLCKSRQAIAGQCKLYRQLRAAGKQTLDEVLPESDQLSFQLTLRAPSCAACRCFLRMAHTASQDHARWRAASYARIAPCESAGALHLLQPPSSWPVPIVRTTVAVNAPANCTILSIAVPASLDNNLCRHTIPTAREIPRHRIISLDVCARW